MDFNLELFDFNIKSLLKLAHISSLIPRCDSECWIFSFKFLFNCHFYVSKAFVDINFETSILLFDNLCFL